MIPCNDILYHQTYLRPKFKRLSWKTFRFTLRNPRVGVFPNTIHVVNTKVCSETRQFGHNCLNKQVVFRELCYITFDHKKHLPERIVPLRVPLPRSACLMYTCLSHGAKESSKSLYFDSLYCYKGISLFVRRPIIPLRMLAFDFTRLRYMSG